VNYRVKVFVYYQCRSDLVEELTCKVLVLNIH